MTYDVECPNCGPFEIEKPIKAPLPPCPDCGRKLKRVYTQMPSVIYAAAGFSATDGRLAKMIGPERAAKLDAQDRDAEERARTGRLTKYEQVLETI